MPVTSEPAGAIVQAVAPPAVDTVDISVVVLAHGVGVPVRARHGDAGADLSACADVTVGPGHRVVVGTGIAIALPPGHVGLVHPRSGLAARTGLTVLNAPGTIDAGYRGEVMVCLVNHDRHTPVQLRRGDRIAQLVVQRVEQPRFRVVDQLPEAQRGERGLGSSGGHARLVGPGSISAPGPGGPPSGAATPNVDSGAGGG